MVVIGLTSGSTIWQPTKPNEKYGVAIYNFYTVIHHGLSLRIGETVQIFEHMGDWFKGCLIKDQTKKGIFPKTCIVLREAAVSNAGRYETVVPIADPIVAEVANVLREWGAIWKRLFLESKTEMFTALKNAMNELLIYRNEIIMGQYTKEQHSEVKEKIILTIDLMNCKLNMDMVPRVNGEVVHAEDKSVVELYNIHLNCSHKILLARNQKATVPDSTDGTPSGYRTLNKLSTLRRNSEAFQKGLSCCHLLLTFNKLCCDVGDPATLCFALYEQGKGCYISENYVVNLDKEGKHVDVNLLGKTCALYMDLTSADITKKIFLICKIYRKGKLLTESKKRTFHHDFRRPFGGAAIEIHDVLSGEYEDGKEVYLPIVNCQEADFGILEEYVTKNLTGKFSAFGSNQYVICISLKMFHGVIEKVTKEKGTCLTQRLGFPEVILPGYVRNDFYVTLYKAEIDKGSKSTAKNIEVTMCVVSSRGQVFSNCIYVGSGTEAVSEYRSYVFYHCNNPLWNETIKISLPMEKFHDAHLRFTFNHCTRHEGKTNKERTFGFSYLKLLQDDSTVIKDMGYDLFIYKVDHNVKFEAVQSYLQLPSHPFDIKKLERSESNHGPARSSKESLTIRTFLCSTKLTQNFSIVNLLRWRKKNHEEVLCSLEKLPTVSPEEVVKFIQDVFDALFNILSERDDEFALPVFKALVSITKIVEDIRYEHFKSTLNSYIDEHFSAALVYKSLIRSLSFVIDHSNDPDLKVTVKNTMPSLPYVFKMIFRSYMLHDSASHNPEDLADIQGLLRELFGSMARLMRTALENLIQSKIEMLSKLPYLCEDVPTIFSLTEFSCYIEDIYSSLPKQGHIHSTHIQVSKLKSFQDIVASKLFTDSGGRGVLLPGILSYLGFQMEKRQELPSCLDLLADVITALQHLPIEEVVDDIATICSCVLVNLINVLLTVERKGHTMGVCVSCLLGLFKLMDKRHYQLFIDSFVEKSDLRDFMMKLTLAFKELLTMDIFPKDWFVLKTVQNHVILIASQYFSKAFTDHFLEEDFFDLKLWNNYFQLSVLFLTQSALKLESFSASKRETLISRYGDMRLIMGFEVLSMWEVLGEKKKYFIPDLIKPMLEMTLVPEPDLRKATVPIFYDMMKVEFAEKHSFEKVESELIEKFVQLINNNNMGDLEYEQLFHKIMMDKFDECPDPKLHEEGMKSIKSITELLRRLLDNRAAFQGNVTLIQKMMCTFRLLEYYKELKRESMYIKCIYDLVELHKLCNNYTEAAFTLLSHASLLQWSEAELPKFLDFPKQKEWERKEQLYLMIIDYFDKGKTWESAIQLCKDLAEEYENKMIDYSKLSQILKKQAYFYDNIMKETRPALTYFRISFYGSGFPHYIKDEVLIFRGSELETLAGFTSRIKSDFPNAEILYKNTPPELSIVQGTGQYIQICTVNPIACESRLFQMKKVHEKILSYYRTNGVSQFVYSRPYHHGERDSKNEFKTLWLERTVHWSKREFPGILKWSSIESTRKTNLTPIENAIESIKAKNRELVTTVDEYKENKELNINKLGMILNGVIDANVNGGIANYQSAFLCDEYLHMSPEDFDFVKELKNLLLEQSRILTKALDVHESLIEDSLRPFHEKMLMQFSAMKISIETGETMENILARPSSLALNSLSQSLGKMTGKSPTKSLTPKGSPKGSPPTESRRPILSKSNSDVQDLFKKDKTPGKGIFSTILRRSSTPVPNVDPALLGDSESKKLPPTPPRKNTIDNSEIPADLSLAAQKRLGIVKSGLANSAPLLGHIEEEETCPATPPKRHSKADPSWSSCGEFTFSKMPLDPNPPRAASAIFYTHEDSYTSLAEGAEGDGNRKSCISNPELISDDLVNMNPEEHKNLVSIFSKINDLGNNHDEERYSTVPCAVLPNTNHPPPPPPLARALSTSQNIPDIPKPAVPSRKLKPQFPLTQTSHDDSIDDDDDDDSIPPPLPKKMSRTHSDASTISNISNSDNT